MINMLFFYLEYIVCWSFIISLLVYNCYRLYIVITFLRTKHYKPNFQHSYSILPSVTVQLPLYNEARVVERLLLATAEIEYPKDLLEIQVLDDSTDETTEIANKIVREYQNKGFNIVLIHRNHRSGFKAGALQEGLLRAAGEFIAIFDSDFIPPRDFLLKTIHYFTNAKVGLVQARWGFTNRNYSYITRFQSILINAWVLEQFAHFKLNRFFNFHGTAGVWRKTTILDAGGWSGDTLCEDLDLSYRAKIKDWDFIYLKELIVPSELPIEIQAFKNQQFRWFKGTTQVRIKVIPLIWKSNLPISRKIELYTSVIEKIGGLFSCFLGFFAVHFCFVELFLFSNHTFVPLTCFGLCFCILVFSIYYSVAETEAKHKNFSFKNISEIFFACIPVAGGISITSAYAFLDGLLGRKTPFVRTTKYGSDNQKIKQTTPITPVTFNLINTTEIIMALYYLNCLFFSISYIIAFKRYEILLLLIYGSGFIYLGIQTLSAIIKTEWYKRKTLTYEP